MTKKYRRQGARSLIAAIPSGILLIIFAAAVNGQPKASEFTIPNSATNAAEFQSWSLPGSTWAGLTPGPGGKLYGVTYDGGTSNKGTIYSFDPATSLIVTLHSFNGSGDGDTPYGELTYEDASQTFVGTAERGGPLGAGTIFRFNPQNNSLSVLRSDFEGHTAPQGSIVRLGNFLYGTLAHTYGAIYRMSIDGSGFTVLHTFSDFGSLPRSVSLAPDGWLYGVSIYGGIFCNPNNPTVRCGTVFRIRPILPGQSNAEFQTLHQPQNAGSSNPMGHVLYGSDGLLYFSTAFRLYRLDPASTNPSSTVQMIWGTGGGTSLSVIEGADGRLYVADYGGGANSSGRIFSIKKDGTDLTVLHTFAPPTGSTGFGPYGRVYRDSTGKIYGTTEYAGVAPNRGVLFLISQETVKSTKFAVSGGDVSISTPGNGIILRSPNGTSCALISINNSGTLVTSPISCP